MNDSQIVQSYWDRSESAIVETEAKHGKYCYRIAYNILTNKEVAPESVNDTYLKAWNEIPSKRPAVLSAFLGKLTRNLAIDKRRSRNAYKRGGGEIILALEELEDCVTGTESVEASHKQHELIKAYERFLDNLPAIDRRIFLLRYWNMESIDSIAEKFSFFKTRSNLCCIELAINKDSNYFGETPKSGKNRTILPAPIVMDALRNQLERQQKEQELAGEMWDNQFILVFTDTS